MTTPELIALSAFVLAATICGTYLYNNVFGTED